MNKHQTVWLIVRAIGLYFAYCALVSVFAVAGSVPDLFSLPKIDAPTKGTELKEDASQLIERGEMLPTSDPEKEREKLESERIAAALMAFFLNLGVMSLYIFGAWYFIRDGRFVFDALVREEPADADDSQREVTRLNLEVQSDSAVSEAGTDPQIPAEPVKKKRAPRKPKTPKTPEPSPEPTDEAPIA